MELKQLEYFVICAETQSFRKASNLLFTTQSNVSKVIKNLEEELGQPLFLRSKTGVTMTEKGKQIYEYATATLNSARRILDCSDQKSKTELKILTNPSSWMANAFCRYYQEHGSSSVSYTYLSSNTHDIINSLTAEIGSIAFIYVMEQQLPFLERQLASNHLSFSQLSRIGAYLYLGGKHTAPETEEKKSEETAAVQELNAPDREAPDAEPEEIALIQGYEDEFTLRSFLTNTSLYDSRSYRYRVAVTTNSDYLMNEMLANTDLGNLSTGYLSHPGEALHRPALPLYGNEQPVLFGCIFRNDRPLSEETKQFLKFIRKRLKEESLEKPQEK